MLGIPFLLWHSAQLRWLSCQSYAPAAFYCQGNSLVLNSVGSWVDPRGSVMVKALRY
jgi:hypothetical protein